MTTALDASRALAKTAIELLTDRPLLDQVRAEWQAR
jgi:hypothetical protein